MEMLTTALLVIAALAFMTSLIIEVLKGVEKLANLPTDLLVVILSFALSTLAYFAYAAITIRTIIWYEVVGAMLGSFIVAFVAMYGWEKFTTLWKRMKPPNP